MSLESRYNYTTIALSPDGSLLIAVNERGEAQLISMVSCTVIHRHKFQSAAQCVVFSPNGRYFAVAKENMLFVFKTPGEISGEYNPFILERHFLGGYDNITWLDWSSDSRLLAIGCRDNTTKIIALSFLENFRTYILSGHTDAIVSCFFEQNSLHLNTLSRNGQLCIWECSLTLSDLTDPKINDVEGSNTEPLNKKKLKDDSEESDDDIDNTVEKNAPVSSTEIGNDENEVKDEDVKKTHPFFYKKLGRYYLADEPRKENRDAYLTASNYNRKTKILVAAFSSGSFYLYEIPDVNLIHSLSITNYAISTALFNSTGDWVALASRELGQLLVWEWQSK